METYAPVKLAFDLFEAENCDKEKAAIIFLHGITSSKECWNDIPKTVANATKRKVYSLDARNHGDSEWSDIFNFDCNEYDLLNFMDSIDAPKVILVGHSMGGITSMKTALHRPERIEKLITEDMSVRRVNQQVLNLIKSFIIMTDDAIQEVPPEVDENTAQKILSEYVYKNLYQNIPPELRISNASASERRFALKRATDGRYAFKTNYKSLLGALEKTGKLLEGHSGVYEGPTYFIYGKASPFLVGKDEELIKQFFPKAELIGIENATHSVHTEFPQEFTEVLLRCLLN